MDRFIRNIFESVFSIIYLILRLATDNFLCISKNVLLDIVIIFIVDLTSTKISKLISGIFNGWKKTVSFWVSKLIIFVAILLLLIYFSSIDVFSVFNNFSLAETLAKIIVGFQSSMQRLHEILNSN